ncbi:hypothetical protein MMC29_000877 [Sticta canariensis]|nr:hypothetical protein [Sticta canariensis]
MDMLGTDPVAPTPHASPQAFFTPDDWEAFPTANLSVPVVFVIVDPVPVNPVHVDPVPLPTSTVPFNLDEKNEESFAMPPPVEPTAEELLRELWRLLKLTLLCMSLDFNDFIRRNPFLRSEKTDCRLRQLFWAIPRQHRSRSRDRSVPCSPIQSRFPVRTRAVSSSPALPSAAAPTPAPAVAPPPSASHTPSTSSANQSGRPFLVERLRPGTERRKDLQRILELEKQVEDLILEIAELRKLELSPTQPVLVMGSASTPPPPTQPVLVMGSASNPPPPTQPVLVVGSASTLPPPAQPVLVMGSASILPPTAVLAPPFQPSSSRYPAPPPPPQLLSFRQPHPRTLGQAGPRPNQFSMDAFVKKYPQTGKKLA